MPSIVIGGNLRVECCVIQNHFGATTKCDHYINIFTHHEYFAIKFLAIWKFRCFGKVHGDEAEGLPSIFAQQYQSDSDAMSSDTIAVEK